MTARVESPRIAVCRHSASTTVAAVELAAEAGSHAGIEITVDPEDLAGGIATARSIEQHSAGAVPVRYHFPLGAHELTAESADAAEHAVSLMRELVSLIGDTGGGYVTVHAPLPEECTECARFEQAAERLRALVEHGRTANVEVAVENLRWGATSQPETFARLAEYADAPVTFDVGHAVSSDAAASGYSAERFARLVAARIRSAHVYGYEREQHHPPEDLSAIAGTLGVLLDESPCDWWTIELVDASEVRTTREMLTGFLRLRYAENSISGG